jgi:hypothetical protein
MIARSYHVVFLLGVVEKRAMGVATEVVLFLTPACITLGRHLGHLSLIPICASTSDALAGQLGRRPAKPMGSRIQL